MPTSESYLLMGFLSDEHRPYELMADLLPGEPQEMRRIGSRRMFVDREQLGFSRLKLPHIYT